MKSILASCILAASLVGTAPLAAQDQNSEVIPVGPDKFLRWFGHAGRTYFVQISDPNEPLRRWVWAPIIESGNGLEISYEVDGTADKGFFRLWFTDEPTADPDGDDFDGDGLDNLAEVSLHQTNPLKADTDGDGLPDAWELAHALDPNDDGANHGASGDPDHDGLTNSEELALAIHPNSADSDGDGSGDRVEADAGADPASPLSAPLRWISAGRRGATMATPPYIYSSWDSNFQTGDYWLISNLVQALATLGFPTSIPTSSLGRFAIQPIGSGSLGGPADYYTSPAGSGEMYQKCYWLEVRPPTPVEIRRSALKVTRTYHDGVEMDPIVEQVEFTIPAGGTLSNRIDLLPALPTFPPNVGQIRAEQSVIEVEVTPDGDQPGHTGDVIPSNKGAGGEKHYVSPKKTPEIPDDFVVLKAKGIEPALFEKVIDWESVPAANGSIDPNDSTKYRVKRDAAGKTVVKLKAKQGGQIADLMNVWVVWATMNGRIQGAAFSANNDLSLDDFEMTQLGSHEVTFTREFPQLDGTMDKNHHHLFISGIEWRSDIEPKSIFELDNDIPDLTKVTQKGQNPPLVFDRGRAYYTHWDVSRDRKMTRILDGVSDIEELNWVIDDDTNYTRDEDPYEQSTEKEESGEIFSVDSPGADTIKKEDFGEPIVYVPDGNSFEVRHVFKEWSRVRLAGKWFDISSKADWYSNVKINKADGIWTAEMHEIGLGVQQ